MAYLKSRNKQIVVLPSWYPNKLEKFDGDFVQRHVKAISSFRSQYVIHVVKDEFAKITNDVFTDITETGQSTEKIIYYHSRKTGITYLDKLLSQLKLSRLYYAALKEYVDLNDIPALIHVHVILKAGLIALWAKRKWNIPFIISEHWSAFLDEANYRTEHLSLFHQWAIKRILKNASALTVVSGWLGKAIVKKFQSPDYEVIPNVVDHSIFFPGKHFQNNCIQFIHASNMVYEKNMESILDAFKILREKKIHCKLNLYGQAPVSLKILSVELGLEEMVFFMGEVDQRVLASKMQQSDALILYSRFETFGCVIIEANASGIPVIVSDIPVFHELVKEYVNGFFVEGENPGLLAEKLIEFIHQGKNIDKTGIVSNSEKYHYLTVGKKFDELYKQVIKT